MDWFSVFPMRTIVADNSLQKQSLQINFPLVKSRPPIVGSKIGLNQKGKVWVNANQGMDALDKRKIFTAAAVLDFFEPLTGREGPDMYPALFIDT